jgi:A/G-specific adenine glycosylase
VTNSQKVFQEKVWDYYHANKRDMPWRNLPDDKVQRLYEVMVSEVMLQQTQVARVKVKFVEWMTALPTLDIAQLATVGDVLRLWSGLGYNRRALWLHEAFRALDSSKLPTTLSELVLLKGIGPNSAASILVYAYNQPKVFIETNIRTVYLHEFFAGVDSVKDKDITTLVAATLDHENPREWYWALMDYGTHLKGQGFANKSSASYAKQSQFEGSFRQLRAKILKHVLAEGSMTHIAALKLDVDSEKAVRALETLISDGLICDVGGRYFVP